MGIFNKQSAKEPPVGRRRPSGAGMPTMRATEMFSYHAHRSGSTANVGRLDAAAIEAAHPAVAHPWYLARWAVISASCIVLFAVLALTNLGGQPRLIMRSTATSRYFLQDVSVYQQAAEKYLNSSPMHKNKLTLDGNDLARAIEHDYPEIKSVSLHKPLIGTIPTITLMPYNASYILSTTSASAYVLDENGHAMIPVGQIGDAGAMDLVTIQDKSGRTVNPGALALPRTTIQYLDTVVAVLKAQNIGIANVAMPAESSELDVYFSGKPYYAKTNLEGDARLQAGTLAATIKQFERDKVTPAQYVDVRVPGRAYYK